MSVDRVPRKYGEFTYLVSDLGDLTLRRKHIWVRKARGGSRKLVIPRYIEA